MTTTTRLIASLALFLAAACGSSQQPGQPAPAPAAPAKVSKLRSMSDRQCDDAPVAAQPTADDAAGMCTAD